MFRILTAVLFHTTIVFNSLAQSETLSVGPYKLSELKALIQVCSLREKLSTDQNCLSYVTAVSDMYFYMNPQCQRPDRIAFEDQIYSNMRIIVGAMPQTTVENNSAVSVVFQAMTSAYPCHVISQKPAEPLPNQEECKKGMELLGHAWVNSFQKQAVLEMLRNSGCLNQ